MFLNYLLTVPAAAALALWEGASWDGSMLVSASGSALVILGYNMTVLIGWIGFNEMPDLWFLPLPAGSKCHPKFVKTIKHA